MRKTILTAISSFAIGAVAAWLIAGRDARLPGGARIIADVPPMSAAEAASHREDRYVSIHSIEDLLALPSHFARMEALYALAGRSDSAAVQDLISQANGIADPSDREDALLVLFARLTELDAPSALALCSTPAFRNDRDFEREVWQRWGALDLDAAVRAAQQLETPARRNLAAQALFAAYDYWGNATTARIAGLLQAEPDDWTRALYLYSLADRDPHAAIEYVNGLESAQGRAKAVMWLGSHFGRDDPEQAREYAALLDDAELREAYASSLVRFAARADPRAVLEAALEETRGRGDWSRLYTAFQALAEQDIDEALGYMERADNRQQREVFAQVIGQALAAQDPERALAWAREYDGLGRRSVYREVLATIARSDPELALAEANNLPSSQARREAYSAIAMTLAQRDVEQAVSFVDRIENSRERNTAVQVVASVWMQYAPEEAVSWILQQETDLREELLTQVAGWLPQRDPQAAMRLLPHLSEGTAAMWRTEIAGALAADRSAAEALRFIAGFEGRSEYPQLLSSVIRGVARRDPAAAVQLAGTLPPGEQRDSVYSGLISQLAFEDPRRAALLLDAITDQEQHRMATQQLASSWAGHDAEAAEQWIRTLPHGLERDTAAGALAGNWQELTPERRRMIDEIGDPDVRRQVVFGLAFRNARADPAEAERVLRSFDLPEAEIEQLLRQLREFRDRSIAIRSY